MPEVRIVKPFRVSSAEPMRMPGEIVDVDEAMLVNLVRLGIVEDPESLGENAEPLAPAVGEPDDGADLVVDEPAVKSQYPRLPEKTAPVAEWREYARINEISLTGVSKRNEIIGYVTRVVTAR